MEILDKIQKFKEGFIDAGKLALELRKEAEQEQNLALGLPK